MNERKEQGGMNDRNLYAWAVYHSERRKLARKRRAALSRWPAWLTRLLRVDVRAALDGPWLGEGGAR